MKNVQLASNNPMFKEHKDKILHAELHINENCIIYMVDNFGKDITSNFIDLILEMDSEDEIKRVYEALCKDGTIKLELQKTFWGALHAMVTDKYGVTWGLNYTIK